MLRWPEFDRLIGLSLLLSCFFDLANPFWLIVAYFILLFIIGKHGNKIALDDGTRLFLYQLVGTWGQLLFPKPWKEFRLWYDEHKAKGIKPILDGMVFLFFFSSSFCFIDFWVCHFSKAFDDGSIRLLNM